MAEDKPTPGDMASFGASDEACYRWPGDSTTDRACRSAFCAGAGWAADTIESLRAQLTTSHALGFKAGIEAARDAAYHYKPASAYCKDISHAIISLPTPPSMLPEILEAMRPFAVEAESYGAAENAGKPFPDALKVGNGNITVGHLRAIAAVVTKLGGKL